MGNIIAVVVIIIGCLCLVYLDGKETPRKEKKETKSKRSQSRKLISRGNTKMSAAYWAEEDNIKKENERKEIEKEELRRKALWHASAHTYQELHAPRTKSGERIYEGDRGGKYIIKKNKDGTPYRYYLPPESIS
tara:strand:- start:36 stop:437 length:402 start_codon:yes stop_codon:yes gene_type:complete